MVPAGKSARAGKVHGGVKVGRELAAVIEHIRKSDVAKTFGGDVRGE